MNKLKQWKNGTHGKLKNGNMEQIWKNGKHRNYSILEDEDFRKIEKWNIENKKWKMLET